jgi:acyl-CoA hydrolase
LQNNHENLVKKDKSPDESSAHVIVRMFPSDANPAGNVFGGEILKHIDMVAGIVAQRHAQSNAVTVSMDSVNFIKPVFVGNVLKLNARINYVHNSSMEIEVKAEAEDIVTGIKTITGTAFVTFVAVDKNGKPIHAPKLLLKTDEDRQKFAEGKIRMEERLKHRKKSNM